MLRQLVISGLLFSCTPDAPHLFVTSNFNDEQINVIQTSANEWCAKSNYRYCPSLVEVDIEKLNTSKLNYVDSVSKGESYTIGLTVTHSDTYTIEIKYCEIDNKDWCLERLRRVALHEFGHTFGKGEDTEIGNVMYPDISYQSEHLTDRDVL
jgi:predicted Zn-dependent protease